MNSNNDGATHKQADNKLDSEKSSDFGSDFEIVSTNDVAYDIRNGESAPNNSEIPATNTIPESKKTSRFSIRKKLQAFASMRRKEPPTLRRPQSAVNTKDAAIPLASNDNNAQKSPNTTETTEHNNASEVTDATPSLGRRKKLTLEGAFASLRGKDANKKRPSLPPTADVSRKYTQSISFISLPGSDSGPLARSPAVDPPIDRESIQYILDEFIATEESYVENLWNGIRNYLDIFQRPDLPETLRGQEFFLFANIKEIGKFHRDQLLPMLLRYRYNIKRIFLELQYFVEQKHFHIYITYTINKQRSMQLIANHRSYFAMLEKEFDDRLGINSFLLQPIQRMTRYPLLMTQFISTLFKQLNSESRSLMTICCRLETRLRNALNAINESECINDIVGIDISKMLSSFLRVGDFEIYDHQRKRNYHGKLFMFEKYLILTKSVDKKLVYRTRYNCAYVQVTENDKGFSLYYKQGNNEEQKCDLITSPAQIELWLKLLREVIPVEAVDFNVYECLEEEGDIYSPDGYSKVGEFDVHDHTLGRKYPAKVYLFEECITYAEIIGERVKFRGSYPFDHLGITPCNGCFTLFYDQRHQQKCDFKAEPELIKQWLDLIHEEIKLHFKKKMTGVHNPSTG